MTCHQRKAPTKSKSNGDSAGSKVLGEGLQVADSSRWDEAPQRASITKTFTSVWEASLPEHISELHWHASWSFVTWSIFNLFFIFSKFLMDFLKLRCTHSRKEWEIQSYCYFPHDSWSKIIPNIFKARKKYMKCSQIHNYICMQFKDCLNIKKKKQKQKNLGIKRNKNIWETKLNAIG